MLRDGQLAELATLVGHQRHPVMLLGDLNASPWSYPFRRLLRDTGLLNSMRGWGVQPTWPAPLGPLGIPIDHVLHSEEIRITRRSTGPWIGSDHLPLIIEFAIEER